MSKLEKVNQLLQNYGQNDQRTEQWHTKRGQMLTASEIYKGIATATPAQKHELIMSKLTPRQSNGGPGSRALIWGTLFEPIAKQIYCDIHYGHIEIADTTCIPHPTVDFLGASPDGIIVTDNKDDFRYGKLVEFKCPISRKFTKDSPIPDAYYHQMQLQMECTGLDECDYIEMEFKELTYSEWLQSTAKYKSFFAMPDDSPAVYKDFNDTRTLVEWKKDELKNQDDLCTICYWELTQWRAVPVLKEPNWLPQNLPSFQQVWNDIQEYRKTGTLPQSPKDKAILAL